MQQLTVTPLGHVHAVTYWVFTDRESAILKQLREGRRYKAIGASLSLTEKTVRTYVYRIARSMGVSGRAEIVARIGGSHGETHAIGCGCRAVWCTAIRAGLRRAA